jgi:hypothetical protein
VLRAARRAHGCLQRRPARRVNGRRPDKVTGGGT